MHPDASILLSFPETDQAPADPNTPTTLEEFQASIHRVLGADLLLGSPIWRSRTVSQARLAETYRVGHVLLSGDAAHLFHAEGSALNIGLMDTVNLGRKLASGWSNRITINRRLRPPAGRRADPPRQLRGVG